MLDITGGLGHPVESYVHRSPGSSAKDGELRSPEGLQQRGILLQMQENRILTASAVTV